MKVGVRNPSVSRRVKARTTGKVKRSVKRAVNPYYGKKGMGMIRDPKKAVYNKVYRKTTIGVDDILAAGAAGKSAGKNNTHSSVHKSYTQRPFTAKQLCVYSILFKIVSVLFFMFAVLGLLTDIKSILILGLLMGIFLWVQAGKYKKMMINYEADNSASVAENPVSVIEFSIDEDNPVDISISVNAEDPDRQKCVREFLK